VFILENKKKLHWRTFQPRNSSTLRQLYLWGKIPSTHQTGGRPNPAASLGATARPESGAERKALKSHYSDLPTSTWNMRKTTPTSEQSESNCTNQIRTSKIY